MMKKQEKNIIVSLNFYNDVIKLANEVQEIIEDIYAWRAEFVDYQKLHLAERICTDIISYIETKEQQELSENQKED